MELKSLFCCLLCLFFTPIPSILIEETMNAGMTIIIITIIIIIIIIIMIIIIIRIIIHII